ncbi:MAG: hypothetical protein NWF08_09465 [Candidatus Bathyarchaeota archaeon]|nr:hypothetical protein [Candidatus Bathyarchaeota archaeon]
MLSISKLKLGLNRRETMTALVFGVIAGVLESIAGRADAILTGGGGTPLAFINTYTWILISAALFGPLGAIITTEVQAFIGLITFANPLSWLWPFINPIFAVVAGFVSKGILKFKPKIDLRFRILAMSVACAILDIPLTYVVVVMALGFPFVSYLFALPVYIFLQLIPSTILTYMILKSIFKSKILEYQTLE